MDQTLDSLGRSRDDVAHLLINQTDRTMHEELLSHLGIPQERSVFNYHRYAHQGPADTFITLADLKAEARLNAGDLSVFEMPDVLDLMLRVLRNNLDRGHAPEARREATGHSRLGVHRPGRSGGSPGDSRLLE